MPSTITVLGAGSWGTAIASLASEDVVLWARREELAAEISSTRRNPRYTGELVLPDRLVATSSLEVACGAAAAVLVCVPSAGFRAVVEEAARWIAPGTPVLSLTKGIERGTHATMTQVLAACVPHHELGVVTGPNLAKEIAAGMPAACVVAIRDQAAARLVQDRLHGPTFRVYTSSDVIGCEVAGATKNVLAIAAGVSDGLGFGDNTRATIITRGLAEMGRLGVALGGETLTFGGLAGVGDLVATCTSEKSRNRRVGIALGQGSSLEEATASVGEVAEGVVSAEPLVALAASVDVELPICEQVAAMVSGRASPADALVALSARPAREEWDVELLRDLRR
jgi:glycerol-3-phosphate dehydrogenase (NAD(P)+)